MLRIHPYNVDAWVAAAKFELDESKSPENARKILLEGLRFNKKSEFLNREARFNKWQAFLRKGQTLRILINLSFVQYFRFELLYVERLFHRQQVLGLDSGDDTNDDRVLRGEVAAKVFTFVSKEIPDAAFLASVLALADDFEEANAGKICEEDRLSTTIEK